MTSSSQPPFLLTPIGFVRNGATVHQRPGTIKQLISEIELLEAYRPGLLGIDEHDWLTVVFGLDRVDEVRLQETLLNGSKCGIFACRSPHRPNRLGLTTCRLLDVSGNVLKVQGLDAADGTPVFDLKCPDTSESEQRLIHDSELLRNPRRDIEYDIRNHLPYLLWLKAGQLTGVLSPELALGVMASLHFMEWARNGEVASQPFTLSAPACSAMTDGALFVAGIPPTSSRLSLMAPTNSLLSFSSPTFARSYRLREMPPAHIPVKEWIEEEPGKFFEIEG